MSMVWDKADAPEPQEMRARDILRAVRRGVPMAAVIFGGALLLVLLRLIERPIYGMARPWTAPLVCWACRAALRLLGLSWRATGTPMQANGAIVANHSSWLDIFVLNARDRVYFVSKDDVAGWPGIGWLARITGTLFIKRDRKEARAQTALLQARLQMGHRLLFFPEGTSTDNLRVLPFKTTLFAAFFSEGLRPHISVQPVSVVYHPPEGARADYYGWWGDMSFGESLLRFLATRRHGVAEVVYNAPLPVRDHNDRKALARACEEAVRTGWSAARRASGA